MFFLTKVSLDALSGLLQVWMMIEVIRFRVKLGEVRASPHVKGLFTVFRGSPGVF
jgi:hypothetical protein